MRFILKTAREQEMEKAARFGFVDGVVIPRNETDRTGRHYDSLVRSSLNYPFPIIGLELRELSSERLVKEVEDYQKLDPERITALFPMTLASLAAMNHLKSSGVQLGISHAVTIVQLLAAVRAGANVLPISMRPFRNYGLDIVGTVSALQTHLRKLESDCSIWLEDAISAKEANEMAAFGADGLVFTWDMLQELLYHPATDQEIERMLTSWAREDRSERS